MSDLIQTEFLWHLIHYIWVSFESILQGKKFVTPDEDFAQWYTDIIRRIWLTTQACGHDHRPYGYAIWERAK